MQAFVSYLNKFNFAVSAPKWRQYRHHASLSWWKWIIKRTAPLCMMCEGSIGFASHREVKTDFCISEAASLHVEAITHQSALSWVALLANILRMPMKVGKVSKSAVSRALWQRFANVASSQWSWILDSQAQISFHSCLCWLIIPGSSCWSSFLQVKRAI